MSRAGRIDVRGNGTQARARAPIFTAPPREKSRAVLFTPRNLFSAVLLAAAASIRKFACKIRDSVRFHSAFRPAPLPDGKRTALSFRNRINILHIRRKSPRFSRGQISPPYEMMKSARVYVSSTSAYVSEFFTLQFVLRFFSFSLSLFLFASIGLRFNVKCSV